MPAAESAARLFGREFAEIRWQPRSGGFSGAGVFAGSVADAPTPDFCLKSFPQSATKSKDQFARITWVHAHMARAEHLGFVPRVYGDGAGQTVVASGGRFWELTAWMPGEATYRIHPTSQRLSAVCASLAALHRIWAAHASPSLPFPAVQRRLALLRDWRNRDRAAVAPELADLLDRAGAVLPRWVAWAERELAPWAGRPVPVQPCLCDIHHDHILFTGDAVTGVIDYAAMKVDHPAVDLARLLGDLVPDDPDRTAAGLAAYHAARGATDVTAELVGLLDRTGTVCAVVNWLLRLSRSAPADPAGVAARLTRLVGRLERSFSV